MKKFFVLYSLKQKLTPTLYKTKITVNKHIGVNKALRFEEFETEEHAKLFIEKISINLKNNKETLFLTEAQVKEILLSIGKEPNNLGNEGKTE